MTIKIAKQVLNTEAQAILRMSKKLNAQFLKAIRLMHDSRGPVILIGMGKPALIAEKISASLASTGKMSFTLHPADALHGDLGRLSKHSAVILLSNSGETDEILRLLPLLKVIQCPSIAITGRPKSTLGKACDAVLDTSVVTEAEPLNVVPTASTTCMLAMGDALTMALVHKRKFKEKDFASLHPGGALGKALRLTVKDVMRRNSRNPLVKASTGVKQVLLKITSMRAGSATVIDGKDKCLGIFTDGDLRRQFKTIQMTAPVSKYMTKNPRVVEENVLAKEALKTLHALKIDEMPVVNSKGSVVGLLDVQDLLDQGIGVSA